MVSHSFIPGVTGSTRSTAARAALLVAAAAAVVPAAAQSLSIAHTGLTTFYADSGARCVLPSESDRLQTKCRFSDCCLDNCQSRSHRRLLILSPTPTLGCTPCLRHLPSRALGLFALLGSSLLRLPRLAATSASEFAFSSSKNAGDSPSLPQFLPSRSATLSHMPV